MNTEPTPSPAPARSSSGRGFRILLTVIITFVVVVGGIGAAVYFAGPYVYERFVVSSDSNTVRLTQMEERQTADVARVTEQIVALNKGLADVESRQTATDQVLSGLPGTFSSLDVRLDTLQTTLDEQGTLLADEKSSYAGLEREVALLRAAENLSRGRLYLLQSNFGLAREDVQTARDLVVKVQLEAPETEASSLGVIAQRLDLALSNLPAFPVIAADDVNVAWELLVGDLTAGAEAPPATTTTTSGADTTTTTGPPA